MDNSQTNELLSASPSCKPASSLRPILGYLATLLVIDLIEIFFYFIGLNNPSQSFDQNLLHCLILSQSLMLSFWVGWGAVSVTLRCFAALVFIECWSFLPIPYIDYANSTTDYVWAFYPKQLFNALLPIFLMVAISLWFGRLLGLRFTKSQEVDSCEKSSRRFQFTIRCLLEWVTITAIFLGSLTYILGKSGEFTFHNEWETFVWEAAYYSFPALLLCWAVLGVRWKHVRFMILVVFAFLAFRLFFHHLTLYHEIIYGTRNSRRFNFSFELFSLEDKVFLTLILLLPSLWFFRILGYRLIWRFLKRTKNQGKEREHH